MGRQGLYDEAVHVVPVLAPQDIVAVATNTDVVGCKEYEAIQFVIQFGVITGATVVVTVQECDNVTPSNTTAIAFRSRLTAAVGTDAPAAWAAQVAGGQTIAAADDNKALLVEVDPAALSDGRPYVRCVLTPGGAMTVCLVSASVLLKPRYPQATQITAVD